MYRTNMIRAGLKRVPPSDKEWRKPLDLDIYISDKISAAAAAAAAAAANISMLFGYEKELRICYEYIYDTPNNPHIS